MLISRLCISMVTMESTLLGFVIHLLFFFQTYLMLYFRIDYFTMFFFSLCSAQHFLFSLQQNLIFHNIMEMDEQLIDTQKPKIINKLAILNFFSSSSSSIFFKFFSFWIFLCGFRNLFMVIPHYTRING